MGKTIFDTLIIPFKTSSKRMTYPFLANFTGNTLIHDLDSDILKEIQIILGIQVTGVCCSETTKKFAEFKEKNYLEFPDILGTSTALSLIASTEPHPVTEQTTDVPTKVLSDAGTRTGRSAVIPLVGAVFENQLIVDGIPLTWGEMTKGLDPRRIPSSEEIVRNIIRVARVFGIARAKYGKSVAITSGYRPANLRIGVSNSQHIPGLAFDSFPLNRGDIRLWYSILRDTPGVMGLGDATNPSRGGFVHVDLRPTRAQVRFGY